MPYLSIKFTKSSLLDFVIPDKEEIKALTQDTIHHRVYTEVLTKLDDIACSNEVLDLWDRIWQESPKLSSSRTYERDSAAHLTGEASCWRINGGNNIFDITHTITTSASGYAETTIRAYYDEKGTALAEAFINLFTGLYTGKILFKDGEINGPYIYPGENKAHNHAEPDKSPEPKPAVTLEKQVAAKQKPA